MVITEQEEFERYKQENTQEEIFKRINAMHKIFPEMCSGEKCYCHTNTDKEQE